MRRQIVVRTLKSTAMRLPAGLLLLSGLVAAPAWAQVGPGEGQGGDPADGEIIVTAQKRSESVNDVGMSINAATGDQLISRGVTDISQLEKIVPGFTFNITEYGLPILTIRGVGYQEGSLASGPAVNVYVDEVPLPYPTLTVGAPLDLERVEVLKGPQGTLFGGNSTGGAVNYIAAKPTDTLSYGLTGSFGRFAATDVFGFISGPLSSDLSARASVRFVRSDGWQKSYTHGETNGRVNQLMGRLLVDWTPSDRLRVKLNANAWRDHSDSLAGQLIAKIQSVPAPFDPDFAAYPLAPDNARAADFDRDRSLRNDSSYFQTAGRLEYDLTDSVTLVSLTSYQELDRYQPFDADATSLNVFSVLNTGKIKSFFQELRLGGQFGDQGNWLVGGNYQSDRVADIQFLELPKATQRFITTTSINESRQKIKTWAVFANADYDVAPGLNIQGGVRYTKEDRTYAGCTRDSGDGAFAAFFNALAPGGTGAVPGGCVTLDATFRSALVEQSLEEDNVSWRVGVNYEPNPDTLLYANVSKGYKSGSFPNITLTLAAQAAPVTQESLLAYEAGVKASLLNRTLQVNAAAFYYDYTDKQLRGITEIPPIGTLQLLVNIPKSHVYGFELSGTWRPVPGLTINPSITLTESKIEGTLSQGTLLGTFEEVGGTRFPFTPRWSGSTDVEYRWNLSGGLEPFVGATATYRTSTNGSLAYPELFDIPGYAIFDLRAGVEGDDGRWKASVYGRNVTNKFYLVTSARGSDAAVRIPGMPVTYGVSFSYRY